MYYVVGLGNPGAEHAKQRHNVGWMVLDNLIKVNGLPAPVASAKYSGRVSEGVIDTDEVILLYPETYMNNSGSAVRKLVPNGSEPKLIVVYDDIDIPLGEVKVSVGRSDGGHNGVKSVIASLGSKEFIRVRVGIAPKNIFGKTKRPVGLRVPKFVLSDFRSSENKLLSEALAKATAAIGLIISAGVEQAMNQTN